MWFLLSGTVGLFQATPHLRREVFMWTANLKHPASLPLPSHSLLSAGGNTEVRRLRLGEGQTNSQAASGSCYCTWKEHLLCYRQFSFPLLHKTKGSQLAWGYTVEKQTLAGVPHISTNFPNHSQPCRLLTHRNRQGSGGGWHI